jgi:NAD(P)-dependent dehydrogenase (short-subunit alcohol dehydrogenase family)/acyl carrier protein
MGSLKTLAQIVDYLSEALNSESDTTSTTKDSGTPTAHAEIEQSLLDIVSRLTGYPLEMLQLDMDIEADLGIDSIKRVEILSTLEEKIPGLPPVPPELMGTLKTLAQIVDYLSEAPKSESDTVSIKKESGTTTPHAEIERSLLDIVSRLTGYPLEMLALDMDIEADLGIDSIKRVEILSTLEEKIPGLPPVPPELMGSLKTLAQIVAYLSEAPKSGSDSPSKTKDTGMSRIDPSDPKTAPTPPDHSDAVKESLNRFPEDDTGFSPEYLASHIGRRVVSIVDSPRVQNKRLTLATTGTVYITDDITGLSQAIVDRFASLNIHAEIISDEIRSDIVNGHLRLENAAGLVIVAGNMPHDYRFLKDAFALTHGLALDLLESGAQDGALFATITRLDGAFGLKGRGMADPLQGGLAGLAKTAAMEWENVCCRAIDIAPDWKETAQIAKAVVAELLNADGPGPVEVGLDAGSRWTLALEAAPYPQGEIALDPGDVVVITGGARGVTASAACALAKHAKPTLILLGRSLHPTPEPEWLAAVHDEAAIKKAILENEFRDNHPTPIHLETAYKKYMSNREIIHNLEKIRKVGANVRYYSVDVRDLDGVSSVLNDIRSEYGPVKAVVHGAGVLNDRLIADKTAEQFDTVFDPKVQGLDVLLEATKKDPLKYLVLFSSVTARIGNKGQADYAMANEALNKIAQQESIQRPDCRVVSINWGPWDGGMVCSALKQKFEKDGVQLIPADAGAMCLVYEMMGDTRSPVEVVIGATIIPAKDRKSAQPAGSALEQPVPLNKNENLFLTFQREVDLDRFPILGAHILGGKPVVPFALIAEWLGHGALHGNPGLSLQGLDDMRIFHGIILEQEKKRIRLMAGKARKNGSTFEVDVEVRNGIKDGVEMIHSGATAILTDQLEPAPYFNVSDHIRPNSYARSIDEIYERILFHGIELRGIQEITGYSSRSISARIASAPSPDQWMTDPLRSRWIADPLVFDCACQMAIIWCFEERGMVSLPSYSASYRQYRDRFPSEGVTAVLEVKEATDHIMTGDFTFLDADNVVVAKLTGYEAVMDASLARAFKPEFAA